MQFRVKQNLKVKRLYLLYGKIYKFTEERVILKSYSKNYQTVKQEIYKNKYLLCNLWQALIWKHIYYIIKFINWFVYFISEEHKIFTTNMAMSQNEMLQQVTPSVTTGMRSDRL